MYKDCKKASISDLRKKSIGMRFSNIKLYVPVGIVVGILLASIIWVAAFPNSNIPAGI